jgi:hypothetical protein
MIKKLLPSIVILLDGEEFGGIGSQECLSKLIKVNSEVLNGY